VTIKESLVKRIEQMDERQLERGSEAMAQGTGQETLLEEFWLLEELASPMAQEDLDTLAAAMRRRPFFGGRQSVSEQAE